MKNTSTKIHGFRGLSDDIVTSTAAEERRSTDAAAGASGVVAGAVSGHPGRASRNRIAVPAALPASEKRPQGGYANHPSRRGCGAF